MQSIIDEPVRGVFGDFSWLRLSGLEACRLFVRGELPAPPVAFGIGSSLVIPGASRHLRMGRPVEDMFDLADSG